MYCSFLKDFNYLKKTIANLDETLQNSLIPSGEVEFNRDKEERDKELDDKMISNCLYGYAIFNNLCKFLGFYNRYSNYTANMPFSLDYNSFLRPIYEEVDQECEFKREYERKDDLVLAYCNYHFSCNNGDIEQLFQYFEDASLSNPIFRQDIIQYFNFSNPDPGTTVFSCSYFNELNRLISLMESNHCCASLTQYFKEPLELEKEEREEHLESEKVKKDGWLYLITGENPPSEEEIQIETRDTSIINLLREGKYTDALILYDITNENQKAGGVDTALRHYTARSYLGNGKIVALIQQEIFTEDKGNRV